MKSMFVAGVVMCVVAMVTSIISTAIPYWISSGSSEGPMVSGHFGLWKICTTILSQTSCVDIPDAQDWFKSVQALMILGILLLFLCLVLSILGCKNDSRQVFQGSVFFAFLGGLVIIIAVIVFGVKEREVKSYFHAGFYLALISGVFGIIAAILLALSKRGSSGYSSI